MLYPSRDELVYPDESISDGLRIEYAPQWDDDFFIVEDPETTLEYPSEWSSSDVGASATSQGYDWEDVAVAWEDWSDPFYVMTEAAPSNSVHLNLPRRLSMAVVDYLKAMKAEGQSNFKEKEYFMKQFFYKLADHESNKRKSYGSFPMSPYAVR